MVVRKSIKTLFKHPKLCLPFILPIFLLFGILLSALFLPSLPDILIILAIFSLPLIILFYLMMNQVCISMVYDLEQRRGISFSSAFKKCFNRLLSVLTLSLLVEIIVTAGMLAFVIPGIYLMCRLSVVEHAAAIEEKGAIESIKRSWDVTRGKELRTFSILLVPGLFFLVVSFIYALFILLSPNLFPFPIVRIISIGIVLAFTLALPVIATTYYYLELTEQEGIAKARSSSKIF